MNLGKLSRVIIEQKYCGHAPHGGDSLDDYPDVRQGMDGYQQLPCKYCGDLDWYHPRFCYIHDEGLCQDCGPLEKDYTDTVTVRL